jgi:hypothetical protein
VSKITYKKLKKNWKKYALVMAETGQTICLKNHYVGIVADDKLEEIYFYDRDGFYSKNSHLYKVGDENKLIAVNPMNPEIKKVVGNLIIAPSTHEMTSCS